MAENPKAGVSGPGPYSKRTDVGTPEMKMGSIAYGEGVETAAIKSGAPLSSTPDTRPTPASEVFAPPCKGLYVQTVVDMMAGHHSKFLPPSYGLTNGSYLTWQLTSWADFHFRHQS